jgi:uncharacterized circularly permuted ATP-grasp superfamily protein
MQEKINVAMAKNEALQETYNQLKNEVAAEQAKKDIIQQQQTTDFSKETFGKIAKENINKTEKGQNIETTNQEIIAQKTAEVSTFATAIEGL